MALRLRRSRRSRSSARSSHHRGHVRRVLNHKSGRRWRVSVRSGKRSKRFGVGKETKGSKRRYRQHKANRDRTALARISHTIFARWGRMVRWQVRFLGDVLGRCVRQDASGAWDFAGLRGAAKDWSRWAWDDAAVVRAAAARVRRASRERWRRRDERPRSPRPPPPDSSTPSRS
jgi:hypothetical protein